MRFALNLPGGPYSRYNLLLSRQSGCTDVIGHGPKPIESSTIWEYGDLLQLKAIVEGFGLKLDVLEDGPKIDKILYDLKGWEKQIEDFKKSLINLGKTGIKVIKPQHMPPVPLSIWRTDFDKITRGDATSTAFNYNLVKNIDHTETFGEYSERKLWDKLKFFLEEVTPTAEEAGVIIAFHPDDPPISPLQGFSRILRSVKAFDRLLSLVSSENVGINFCQGCFAEMGENVPKAIRHFEGKICFAHFRNVIGTVYESNGFQEIFHDDNNGRIDMLEAMKAYYQIGFEGPIRPDHAPKMGEETIQGGSGGYEAGGKLGKLLGLGYMKGLAESIEKFCF
jgi:mannonate dehydratase